MLQQDYCTQCCDNTATIQHCLQNKLVGYNYVIRSLAMVTYKLLIRQLQSPAMLRESSNRLRHSRKRSFETKLIPREYQVEHVVQVSVLSFQPTWSSACGQNEWMTDTQKNELLSASWVSPPRHNELVIGEHVSTAKQTEMRKLLTTEYAKVL